MKHILAAARYSGIELAPGQIEKLHRFQDWLGTEASDAGGIGPAEGPRIEPRHLADSLLFLSQIPADAAEIWDLGSGVGLPGIPLAIALPEVEVTLLDRSRRRNDLARRAIRILDLKNCEAVAGDIEDLDGQVPVIVSRASLPPEQLTPVVTKHLAPGGVAILAGSWTTRPDHPPWVTVEIPEQVLDQSVWLLIMRRQ